MAGGLRLRLLGAVRSEEGIEGGEKRGIEGINEGFSGRLEKQEGREGETT